MMLTDENKQLLKYTHEHRLVQPRHMHWLGCGILDYLYHRMPKMAKHRYLKRITWPRTAFTEDYAAYQLDIEGRKVLTQEFDMPSDWMRFKRKPIDTRWIRHTLLTTDVSVRLRSALGEAFTPLPITSLKSDTLHAGKRFQATNIPDHSFSLTLQGKTTQYHIEADTGSMPIYRINLSQQSIYKKLLGYVGAMRYARKRFGVLIVTMSPSRAFDMVGILRPKLQHLEGDTYKNLILFTHEAQLPHDPLHWTNLVGESANLLPE